MKTAKAAKLFLFVIALATSATAQQKAAPITVQRIELPASGMLKAERIVVPSLSQTDKLIIINDSLKQKGLPKAQTLVPAVKLSVTNPRSSQETYLSYFKPHNVMVIGDSAQFSAAQSFVEGGVVVSFKPPAPGNYLFDLSVKKVSAMSFNVLNLDGKNSQTLNYPVSNQYYSHVTFLMSFADVKPKVIAISGDQVWSFFDCEITQVK